MKYSLVLSAEALKQVKDLDKPVRTRIFKELPFLESHPMSGKLLTGDLRGARTFRVGKYRVIYRLTECNIVIITILHHKKVLCRLTIFGSISKGIMCKVPNFLS